MTSVADTHPPVARPGRLIPLLRKLADILTETGLTEIEYEVGDPRVRVARGGIATVSHHAPLTHGHATSAAAAPAAVFFSRRKR